jgi:predicted Rdx family selenoprotein
MLYDEAKRIDEEIRELCKDSKHPSRTMSKEVMRALNSELEKIRKRSKGGGGGRFSASMDQTQMFNMEKLKSFDVPSKYEKQILKALEKAKEYAGIED